MRLLALFVLFFLPLQAKAQLSAQWVDVPQVEQLSSALFIAPDGLMATQSASGIQVQDVDNTSSYNLQLDASVMSDKSFAFYPTKNGSYRIRSAISNFQHYDAANRLLATLSNSSGSQLGEGVSSWYTNANQDTWVLATALIKTESGEGSAAYIWQAEQRKALYYSANERLIDVDVSDDGLFVAVSYGNDAGALTKIFDRQANELLKIEQEADFELQGAEISADGEYVTVFSSRRAIVYGLPSGKVYGSTSVRNTLVDVELQTSNGLQLYVLMGDLTENSLNQARLRMVDISRRKIEKSDEVLDIRRLNESFDIALILEDGQITTQGLAKKLQLK